MVDRNKQHLTTGAVNGIDIYGYVNRQIDAIALEKQAQAQGILERLDRAQGGINEALAALEDNEPGLFARQSTKDAWSAEMVRRQEAQERVGQRKAAVETIISGRGYEESYLHALAEQKFRRQEPDAWRAYRDAERIGGGVTADALSSMEQVLAQQQSQSQTQTMGRSLKLAMSQ